jgi:hypothetical protein
MRRNQLLGNRIHFFSIVQPQANRIGKLFAWEAGVP